MNRIVAESRLSLQYKKPSTYIASAYHLVRIWYTPRRESYLSLGLHTDVNALEPSVLDEPEVYQEI